MDTNRIKLLFFKILSLLLFISSWEKVNAYNFKVLSNESGLSNSAVLSMFQDHKGYMWFGTCDGLNVYDGYSFQVYKPSANFNSLSGNIIENVIETHENIFWIQTNYGLDKLDRTSGNIENFSGFKEKSYFIQTKKNDFYIIKKNEIYHYVSTKNNFRKYTLKFNPNDKILDVNIDSNNNLWVFRPQEVNTYRIKKNSEQNEVTFEPVKVFFHNTGLLYVCHEKDVAFFIDQNFDLFEYNFLNNTTRFITNLKNEVSSKGEVTSIIKHNRNYLIGFKTNGLLQLKPSTNRFMQYEKYELEIKAGIFCLLKDKFQDIIWIGTDGHGVYLCSSDPFTVKSITFNNLISKPIRAIFLDKERNLWIGTKGDGILKISNYSDNTNIIDEQISHIHSSNSLLSNNSVYAFGESKKDILWIGHEDGLNYYSYKDRIIKKINLEINHKPIKYIHSICELNDTTLWLASVGDGIIQAIISGTNDHPQIKSGKQITIENGKFSANYFFSLYKENDTILWFGNRGYGAYRINTKTLKLDTLKFGNQNNNKTLDDVFSISIDKDNNYWFGTSFGLVKFHKGKKQIFNESHGFPNNTIHGILKDSNGNLWLSTNQGIIRFDRKMETFQVYNQNTGLEVVEFSDGAYFKNQESDELFFGGINGLVTIKKNKSVENEKYAPKILFNDLKIFGKKFNINDFYNRNKNSIQLKYFQNFFSIKLTVIDYINNNNYSYSYKLEGLNNKWIENGKSNIISFTNIPPGNYILYTRYRNLISNVSSEVASIKIRIIPPWYKTTFALVIYLILYVILVFLVHRLIKRWYKLKNMALEAKMNENKKKELYESKLQFFINITHELCTPLTLIQGPCEKILSYPAIDYQIKKYASLIKNNSTKLNDLIQELIEFGRINTDNKAIKVESIPVSIIAKKIVSSFSELAKSKKITYFHKIQKDIIWNTDLTCFSKILKNLITYALKNTSQNGTIEINLFVKDDHLHLSITNSGEIIKKERIYQIFDRYKILDEFEGGNESQAVSRNGFGLAICHSMVQLLKGKISITNIADNKSQFIVSLPLLSINKDNGNSQKVERNFNYIMIDYDSDNQSRMFYKKNYNSENRITDFIVLIIDEDEEMMWFLSDLFSDLYYIVKMKSAEDALDYLGKNQVNLIIADIDLPEMDGISFTKNIKENKMLAHIPVILLSAFNSPVYQINSIKAGADLYLSKPFNTNYLLEIVNRFLVREKTLKNYYNSIFSAIELKEGTYLNSDDKDFFVKVLNIIEANISDPNLSADKISVQMSCSKRTLYRKLKKVTNKSLMKLIRDYRYKKVERLLISTQMSVDEIMFQTGFHNRGHFYKTFKIKYNQTPIEFRNAQRKYFKEANKIKEFQL